MSLAAELALIRQAYEALPQGTPQERTAWILQRKRELQAEAPVNVRRSRQPEPTGPKPFSHVADDPAVKRSQEDK